jgi:hypothetical protein
MGTHAVCRRRRQTIRRITGEDQRQFRRLSFRRYGRTEKPSATSGIEGTERAFLFFPALSEFQIFRLSWIPGRAAAPLSRNVGGQAVIPDAPVGREPESIDAVGRRYGADIVMDMRLKRGCHGECEGTPSKNFPTLCILRGSGISCFNLRINR